MYAKLARALGAFARQASKPYEKTVGDNGVVYNWYFVEFSAEATGELVGGGKYRLKDPKPMKFEDPNSAP